jgi:multiple sugar transport system substrate-binding protein
MNAGVLLPLDDMVQEQGLDLSTFNQGIVGEALGPTESCSFEGQLYCLGSYTGMVALFYNKDMFDAAGVPYPAAWPPMSVEEFVDVACQLTDPENEVWGAAYGDPVTFLPWETVVSSDGRTATGYVNGPNSVSAHEVLARGIQEGCAPSLNILDPWEQGTDYFARGQLAMVVTDFQSLNKIENAGVNYGVTGSPTAEGVEPWFNVWTDSVGVFANTEHPDEAELFIAFMATDGQRLRVQETGDLPLDTAVAEELDWAGGTPGREEGLEVLLNARQGVFVPNRWDTFGPIFDAYGLIVGGEMSAQEALDEAASAIQENLDQAWEAWEEQG